MKLLEPLVTWRAVAVLAGKAKVEAAAEVILTAPDVVVCNVRLAPVTLKLEAAPDAIDTAPAPLLPMETVPVELPVLIEVLLLLDTLS